MLLGIGITGKTNLPGNPVLHTEYRQCDKCGAEFRLYFQSRTTLDEALAEISRKLNRNGHEDLCFNCQNEVPAVQLLLPLG